MNATELFLLLFGSICVLGIVAERLKIALPIAFVIGGVALGFIPEFSDFTIPPQYILFIFLPPLLMEAAYFTSIRDFRLSIVSILQLALGLVVVTMLAVCLVAQALIPGMTFALGCVLGAIISPPDAVAATSLVRNHKIPKKIVDILEGESLVNDATGLVLYGFAVIAVTTGSFSLAEASVDFIYMALGGCAIGLLCGWFFIRMFNFIRQPSIEILSTFLVPYAAYLIAESVHASGVLSVVIMGLYVAWHAPQIFRPDFRIPAHSIWRMVVFVFNALVFLLIGVKVPGLFTTFSGQQLWSLSCNALIITLVAVVVRMVWVFTFAYGTRYFFRSMRERDPYPAWQNVFLVGWLSMRGVVSLATALALPLTVVSGDAFPLRDEILFLTLAVILITLIGQGLTLPFLLRKLPLSFNPRLAYEEWFARQHATKQALARLHEVSQAREIHPRALNRVRGYYEDRLTLLGDGPNTPLPGLQDEDDLPKASPIVQQEHQLWQEVLKMEQESIQDLRRGFHIGDNVMHALLSEIDLLASSFK
jgi:CPA1 family monovalent cation:H+ antiporter